MTIKVSAFKLGNRLEINSVSYRVSNQVLLFEANGYKQVFFLDDTKEVITLKNSKLEVCLNEFANIKIEVYNNQNLLINEFYHAMKCDVLSDCYSYIISFDELFNNP